MPNFMSPPSPGPSVTCRSMPVPFEGPPDELSGLTMFLDEQRAAILRKTEGVSEQDAVRTTTVSSFSLLTLVKHLAFVERRWFREAVAGRQEGLWPPADPAEEMRVDPGDTLAGMRRLYQDVIAEARDITAEAAAAGGGADTPCAPSAEGLNLR